MRKFLNKNILKWSDQAKFEYFDFLDSRFRLFEHGEDNSHLDFLE